MASQSGDNIFAIANSTAENATDDDVLVAPNADYHKWYSGAFDEDVYPLSHKRAEAILLKVTAGLSICGSLIIMAEVIKDHRMKRGKVLNRILLNLCIADLISSFAWFLSSWPTPQDDQGYYWRQVVYNVGNQATCTFQGFILEFGTMAALFIMVLLAWCYCLTLRYGWADEKLKPLEKYAYPIAWIPALVWALIPIPLDMYNNRYYVCKIEPYPIMCWETWTLLPGQTPDCIRGDNASLVRLYKMGIVWACILVVLVLFVMTICAVRKTERRAARWNHPVPEHEEQGTPPRQRRFSRFSSSSLPSSSGLAANSGRTTTTRRRSSQTAVSSPQPPAQNNRRYWRTKVIFKQCALYIIAYVITWVPMTINNYFIAIDFKGSWGTYFDTVASALVTMQGFWNFLIFLERRKMKTKVGGCLKSIFCCCPSLVQWCKRRRETRHGLATSENDGLYDESSSEEDEEEEEEEEETNKVEVAVEDIRELEEEKDEEPSDPLATLD